MEMQIVYADSTRQVHCSCILFRLTKLRSLKLWLSTKPAEMLLYPQNIR